ncbi:hypothetical protein D9M71_749200 [compost metagenome]
MSVSFVPSNNSVFLGSTLKLLLSPDVLALKLTVTASFKFLAVKLTGIFSTFTDWFSYVSIGKVVVFITGYSTGILLLFTIKLNLTKGSTEVSNL